MIDQIQAMQVLIHEKNRHIHGQHSQIRDLAGFNSKLMDMHSTMLKACRAALSLLTNPDADDRDADAVTDQLRQAIEHATH